MSAIDRRQVRRHFSASARHYDGFAEVQKRVALRVAGKVGALGVQEGRFLEIGSGTGYLSERVAMACPALQPLVSDLAHSMTLLASRRLTDAWAVDLDAAALPLASDCLPLICSASVYQWVENLPMAFSECLRVLQPGGVFVFALFGDRTLWELKDCYRQAVLFERGTEPDHLHVLPSRDTVERSLREGGFTCYEVSEELEGERHASVTALLRSIKGVGAHNASRKRPRGLASRRIMNRLAENYRQRFSDQGSLLATYHVIYGVARKS